MKSIIVYSSKAYVSASVSLLLQHALLYTPDSLVWDDYGLSTGAGNDRGCTNE